MSSAAMGVLPTWEDDPPTTKPGETRRCCWAPNSRQRPLQGPTQNYALGLVRVGPGLGPWPDNQHNSPLAEVMGRGGHVTHAGQWVSVLDFHWEGLVDGSILQPQVLREP